MKTKLIIFTFTAALIYFFNACNESSTNEPPPANQVADSSYFPNNDGAYYQYSTERPDSNNNPASGTRSSYYVGFTIIGPTSYQLQVDSIFLTGQSTTVDSMFFRISVNNEGKKSGVFYYLDTTGFAASFPGLDTLLQDIIIDAELRLLLFPIYDNSNWTVFKMHYQPFNFNPVEMKAAFDKKETLTLNINPPRNVETIKLKFSLTVRLNPLTPAKTYIAYGWVSPGIGFVKWEGSGTIVGVFTGNGIDFDDTTSVFIENLTDYNLID